MLRRVAFPLSLAAATAVAGLAAASLGAAPADVAARVQSAPNFPNGPYYTLGCSFSHRNNDDPIVFPGQPGRSHNHTYVGNRSVNAATTPETLVGGRTTCESDSDSSGYWMPTLYVGDNDVTPLTTIVYYVNRSRERISAPPKGLVMIAGNANATTRQPKGIVSWSCGAVGARPRYYVIPACRDDQMLQLQATFPNCWDGRRLDSPDHKAHVRYASRGICPSSHPIAMPQLIIIALYPPVPLGSEISSGRFGAHADFMNGWDQAELERLVTERNFGR
ncbi:MAG TPA: DUF1996 domain-containing protein [Gaiellaceae bacterium]|nr:DUF1996 domain-containing protein [Gaiellaceae bacterium]